MTTQLEPRLDDFERRLHELERELAVLRSLSGNGRVTVAPETVVAAVHEETFAWAYELIERGDFRSFFNNVERARRNALANNDLPALVELSRVAGSAEQHAPIGVDAEARRLGYAIRQNARFVARKLGVGLDEAALRPEPAQVYDYEQEARPPQEPDRVPERPAARPAPERPATRPSPERPATRPRPERVPAFVPAAPAPPRPPRFQLPELSSADLFGAKALAIAGGIVTLLGIIFFFVLAVNRGWVGPEGRVALGGTAALLAYGAGLELRRRYGETYSSLAAVAAGIAGAYGVLLAAAQLYHFVGHLGALLVAAVIAGIGLATALRWRSQMIAGLGLLGAVLAPLAVAAQDGLSVLGTSFVAFMAVATAAVAIRERWDRLLVVGALASLPQALALAMQAKYSGVAPAGVVADSAVFAGITVGTGIARQLRSGRRDLFSLPVSFLFAGTTFGAGCALRLYGSPESRGFALLALAIALGVGASVLFPRSRARDLSALVAALGLVVGGIAFGELMSGSPLAFAWAGEAATLAWLARRVKDIRYQLWSLVYLVAAVVHVLAIDMTPRHLFKPLEISAGGALAVVAVGLAAGLVAWHTAPRAWGFPARKGFFRVFVPLLRGLGASQRELRLIGYWLAAAAAVYAASLGILAAVPSFDWGHVAMYSFWSAMGAGGYALGLRRRSEHVRFTGLAWLVVTGLTAIANGQAELTPAPRAAACLIAGTALLAATLVELFAVVESRFARLPEGERTLRLGVAWGAGIAAVAALSVGIVAAVPSFDWGRVAMFCLWSAIGLGVFAAALIRRAPHARFGALAALVVTDAAAIWTCVALLGRDARATACLVAGIVLLGATLVELFGQIAPRYEQLTAERRVPWLAAAWGACVVAVAALSVGVVAAIPSHDWSRATMFSIWAALGLGVLVAALRRNAPRIRTGALAGFAITAVASFTTGEKALAESPRGTTFLVVGGALLVAVFADQLLPRRRALEPVAVGFVILEAALGLAAFVALLGGSVGSVDERGLAFLCFAALHVVLAMAMYRIPGQRDFSTLLWGTGLVLAYGASERLVPGTYHVLTLALAAGFLAWLAKRLADARFLTAGAACVVVGVATAVIRLAPPGHLFQPHEHPGAGALAVLFGAVAAASVAALAGEATELRRRGRSLGFWTAGVLTVYGLSLLILALFQVAFAGSVDTNFHRGHTAVSAFWGLIGLGLLYFGLTRLRVLRVAGFAMFAVSLAKIFLFDLPSLNSITRALSFLAVGAVLLAGGFFYQRLSAKQPPQPERVRGPVVWPTWLRRADVAVALAAAAAMVVWFGSGIAPLG